MVQAPAEFMIVAIGGAGKPSAFIPPVGATHAVTRALKLRDGQLAPSVEAFRRR
jgi:hypothetical protein